MNEDTDYQDIQNYLNLQAQEVFDNVEIVDPSKFGTTYALHIDKRAPDIFIPRMPKSAAPMENDSCPRVTVACTVIGCYIGYFRGETDLIRGSNNPENLDTHKKYLGGYEISRVDFKHALKPNSKLVFDAETSEELWLVPYNEEAASYEPIPVGKIFTKEVRYTQVTNNRPRMELIMYLENNKEPELLIMPGMKVGIGHYRLHVNWESILVRSVKTDDSIKVVQITEDEYEENKRLSAAMLSFTEGSSSKPSFSKW